MRGGTNKKGLVWPNNYLAKKHARKRPKAKQSRKGSRGQQGTCQSSKGGPTPPPTTSLLPPWRLSQRDLSSETSILEPASGEKDCIVCSEGCSPHFSLWRGSPCGRGDSLSTPLYSTPVRKKGRDLEEGSRSRSVSRSPDQNSRPDENPTRN